jgi:hypothetical protein
VAWDSSGAAGLHAESCYRLCLQYLKWYPHVKIWLTGVAPSVTVLFRSIIQPSVGEVNLAFAGRETVARGVPVSRV